jgi:hypothetical protein
MNHEEAILQELMGSALAPLAAQSPLLASHIAHSLHFWSRFSPAFLLSQQHLIQLLTDYHVPDPAQYWALWTAPRAQYLSWLAHSHLSGTTTPTAAMLIANLHPEFADEVSFLTHMNAAILLTGRAALQQDLVQAAQEPPISSTDIAEAYQTLQQTEERNNLRHQLQQWQLQDTATAPPPSKVRRTIPLLFFRFAAAAAAVITVVTTVVVIIRHRPHTQTLPSIHYNIPVITDTTIPAPSLEAPIPQAAPVHTPQPATATTATPITRLPRIELRGTVVDVLTNMPVTDVAVTLSDENGQTQTFQSTDGTFTFILPLHHNFVVTGLKDNYRSARLTLSTIDVQDADPDDTIPVTLRLTKAP